MTTLGLTHNDAAPAWRAVDSAATDIEELYTAHFQSLTIQLYAYTGDLAAAQDLVQEAFCRAIPRWPKLSTYDDPLAWVRRVAFNLAISRFRRIKTALSFGRKERAEHVVGPNPDRVASGRGLVASGCGRADLPPTAHGMTLLQAPVTVRARRLRPLG